MTSVATYALLAALMLHGACSAETETLGNPFRNAKVNCPTVPHTHVALLDAVGPDVPAEVASVSGALAPGVGIFWTCS